VLVQEDKREGCDLDLSISPVVPLQKLKIHVHLLCVKRCELVCSQKQHHKTMKDEDNDLVGLL
jgi:hypothetical protein